MKKIMFMFVLLGVANCVASEPKPIITHIQGTNYSSYIYDNISASFHADYGFYGRQDQFMLNKEEAKTFYFIIMNRYGEQKRDQ